MRVLIGAALAVFLSAAPAAAQTETPALQPSRCAAFPASPGAAPDGATANQAAMTAYDEGFRAWAAAADAVIVCRNAELDAVRQQYEALRAAYTADAEGARAQITSWQAEVNEFNERPPSRRR
jgi:hypothetical protein